MRSNTMVVSNKISFALAFAVVLGVGIAAPLFGNQFITGSTKKQIRVEICAQCHPFFTGEMKFVDVMGRVEKFQKRAAATAGKKYVSKRQRQQKQRLAELYQALRPRERARSDTFMLHCGIPITGRAAVGRREHLSEVLQVIPLSGYHGTCRNAAFKLDRLAAARYIVP